MRPFDDLKSPITATIICFFISFQDQNRTLMGEDAHVGTEVNTTGENAKIFACVCGLYNSFHFIYNQIQ